LASREVVEKGQLNGPFVRAEEEEKYGAGRGGVPFLGFC
jgi:hypothetical protein